MYVDDVFRSRIEVRGDFMNGDLYFYNKKIDVVYFGLGLALLYIVLQC